jgi:hypothetical protein
MIFCLNLIYGLVIIPEIEANTMYNKFYENTREPDRVKEKGYP